VKQALGSHNLAPAIDFTADVNLMSKVSSQPLSREQYYDEQFSSLQRSNLQNWNKLFEQESGILNYLRKLRSLKKPQFVLKALSTSLKSKLSLKVKREFFSFNKNILCARGEVVLMFIDQASGS